MPYWHAPSYENLPMWVRRAWCRIRHGGHERYTYRHADEPDVTYCLRCRTTLEADA